LGKQKNRGSYFRKLNLVAGKAEAEGADVAECEECCKVFFSE
jgi:hypothetical protein